MGVYHLEQAMPSPAVTLVLAALLDACGTRGWSRVTNSELTQKTGLQSRTIMAALAELETGGAIKREQERGIGRRITTLQQGAAR